MNNKEDTNQTANAAEFEKYGFNVEDTGGGCQLAAQTNRKRSFPLHHRRRGGVARSDGAVVTTATATKRIEGQVFIVSKSGTAVKLALVQVSAIPLGQTEQCLREVEREVIGERHKADSFVDEAKTAVRNATNAREQHYQA